MSSPSHRPSLIAKMAKEIEAEFLCQRTSNSWLGDQFEFAKSKLRFRMSKEEIEQLAVVAAAVLIDCDTLVSVRAKRVPNLPLRKNTLSVKDKL